MIMFQSPYPNDGFVGTDDYDGLRLEVFGQHQCQLYEPQDGEVCISITSQGHGVAPPNLGDKFADLITLQFDDVQIAADGMTINSDQAEKIAKFVMKHRDKKKIVIHCFAGISRSRSTAAAIAYALRLPYHFTINNKSVYRAVLRALSQELDAESSE